MKIDKNLAFLAPFIESTKDFVPIEKINRVIGYKVPVNKQENQYASITKCKDKYNINIKITNNDFFEQKQRPAYIADILSHLAHEMAHLKDMEHNHRHLYYEAKILMRFSKGLKKANITNTYARIKLK